MKKRKKEGEILNNKGPKPTVYPMSFLPFSPRPSQELKLLSSRILLGLISGEETLGGLIRRSILAMLIGLLTPPREGGLRPRPSHAGILLSLPSSSSGASPETLLKEPRLILRRFVRLVLLFAAVAKPGFSF